MTFTIFDIETDGLLDKVTKIHCLSYSTYYKGKLSSVKSLSKYSEIKSFILSQRFLVGHNIIRFDIPVLEKLLGIKIEAKLIDTLGLSWYLTPSEIRNGIVVPKRKHGLESWGEYYKVPKPEIDDWENLSLKDYCHRCEEDVKINSLLWIDQYNYLLKLYDNNITDVFRAIDYLSFKLDCLKEQEENPCHIDKKSCEENLTALNEEIEIKELELSSNMPLKKNYRIVTKPKKPLKKDGSLSVTGQRWENWIKEFNLDPNVESFEMLESVEEGNPNSHKQIKDWLLSLGWKPTIIKEATSKITGITSYNPQLSNDDGLCPNLKEMFTKYPYLANLENLALMQHRKGIFESFLDSLSSDNTVVANIGGFTNSLRMQHRKPIVNLPKVGTYLGEQIRGLIVIPNEDYLICGSDISSLEDSTKQHFMYFFDPEYVKQMRVPGFDPHIDIAIRSNIMTEKEGQLYKDLKKNHNRTSEENKIYQELDFKRFQSKTGNFACLPTDNTEVLTVEGWKYHSELSIGEDIFSYNIEEDCLEITPLTEIPYYEEAEVIDLKNNHFEFECTDNHRWYCEKRVRTKNNPHTKKSFFEAKDIVGDCNIIQSSKYNNTTVNNNLSLRDCELLGWILADGWIYWSKKSLKTSSSFGVKKEVRCGISQKKYTKELDTLMMQYPHRVYTREDNVSIYTLLPHTARKFLNKLGFGFKDKHEIDYQKLIISMSYEQRNLFLYTFHLADGGRTQYNKIFYQNRGNILDAVTLALTLNGESYTIGSNGFYKGMQNVTVNVKNRQHITGQKLTKEYSRTTSVFCANNKNNTFIAKQGDYVSITGNSVYGAGPPKLASVLKCTMEFATNFHEAYWIRNEAVKKVASNTITKKIGEQLWLYNPISKLWYSLRVEKDIFSVLNQGTGAYVEDRWIFHMRKKGLKMILQYHDEVAFYLKKEDRDISEKMVHDSMEEVNKELQLNVPIKVSMDFGVKYSEIH